MSFGTITDHDTLKKQIYRLWYSNYAAILSSSSSSSSWSACLLSLVVLETSASVQSAVAQLQLQDTLGRETPNTQQNYTNMQLAEEVCVFVCACVVSIRVWSCSTEWAAVGTCVCRLATMFTVSNELMSLMEGLSELHLLTVCHSQCGCLGI